MTSIMKSTLSRGAFIVFEGLDRSGKSTQSIELTKFLISKGFDAKHLRFPDRETNTGKKLSEYLGNATEIDDIMVHKLFSENRREKANDMESMLLNGTSLVVDRYSFSGVAFSSAKGLDSKWCKTFETKLIAPDIVFFLDIPVEIAANRGNYGSERYEKIDFQRKVATEFLKLQDETWHIIDATKTWEDIQAELQNVGEKVVRSCLEAGKPIRRLFPEVEGYENT